MSTTVQKIDKPLSTNGSLAPPVSNAQQRDAVANLAANLTEWSREQGWTVRATSEEIPLGDRELPWLFIGTPKGRIAVDPIDGKVIGAEGRVDLISWPDLDVVMLLRRGDAWFAKTDGGSRRTDPLNRESFLEIVNRLTSEE